MVDERKLYKAYRRFYKLGYFDWMEGLTGKPEKDLKIERILKLTLFYCQNRSVETNHSVEVFRAIEVCTDLTKRKKAIIKELLTSYRKIAKKIASYQWKLVFQAGSFNRKANIKTPSIRLVGEV